MGRRKPQGTAVLVVAALATIPACGPAPPPLPPEESVTVPAGGTVVIYVEAPKRNAGPVLRRFSRETGIEVKAVYREQPGGRFQADLEAEAAQGKVDLLWGSTPLTALRLARAGRVQPFRPAGARPIPGQYRDPQFRWVGFAGNPRVIIYNHDLVKREEAPASVSDMALPPWGGKGAMARIRDGGPAFHAATLFTLWGRERARAYFDTIAANGTRIAADDAAVRQLVASGEALWGIVALDEAICAKRAAEPVHIFFPDRMSQGAIVPPYVAALLRGAPHPAEAKGLFAWLLYKDAAEELSYNDCAVVTLLPDIRRPDWVPALGVFNVTQVDNEKVFDAWTEEAAYFEAWGGTDAAGALTPASAE